MQVGLFYNSIFLFRLILRHLLSVLVAQFAISSELILLFFIISSISKAVGSRLTFILSIWALAFMLTWYYLIFFGLAQFKFNFVLRVIFILILIFLCSLFVKAFKCSFEVLVPILIVMVIANILMIWIVQLIILLWRTTLIS